jgi:predicted TIM-barrel fold metal-dependent hydrolase
VANINEMTLHRPGCQCGIGALQTRRNALLGASAVVGGLLADSSLGRTLAQAVQPNAAGIIDVHHHLSPPTFITALNKYKLGERPILNWTPARSIEDMDRAGVAVSITSITHPGLWYGDLEETRRLSRECNDYAAKLAADYPGRFGIFSSIPLPDIEGSLREIEYAFDTLKADGIGVMTSFSDKWLGDKTFDPVMQELDRRKAVLYTHPTVANCCRNLLPDVHYSVVELATDTTRAIANLVFSGTASRYPNIRFIFSHAGGAMPYIYQRFAAYPLLDKGLGLGLNIGEKVPSGVLKTLQSFYYDTAQTAYPTAMEPLKKLIGTSQILFGTDYPFRASADYVKALPNLGFSDAELAAIYRENAIRMMPRLADMRVP